MTRRSRARPPRTHGPLAPTALELADAFIAEFHAADDPGRHETIRSIVLAAGAAASFVDPDRPLDAAAAVLATGTTNPIVVDLCQHILAASSR